MSTTLDQILEAVIEVTGADMGNVQVVQVRSSLRDARVATQLYRIAQEAVTNVVKHAHPTTISIEMTDHDGVVKLRVVDDGIGIQDPKARGGGLGLRIMRYRATSIGAQFGIDAGPRGGTAVVCTWRESPTSSPPEGRS